MLQAEGARASKSQSFPAVWLQVSLLRTHSVSESQCCADWSSPSTNRWPYCQQTIHCSSHQHHWQQR